MESNLVAALLIGLAGSVHCISMCGGVVAGLGYAIPAHASKWPYIFCYNLGRITSYSLAGSLAGTLGAIFSHKLNNGFSWLNLISGVFLLLLGAYIGNWWRVLAKLEKAGHKIWKVIHPISKQFIPFKTPLSALPYGLIWGWLPCGLVYSTLSWSLASGSAVYGGLTMLFFGMGTLPSIVLIALASQELKSLLENPKTQQIIAIGLCIFGIYNISQALQVIL